MLALKFEPFIAAVRVVKRRFLPGILCRMAGVAFLVFELSLVNVVMAIIAIIRLDICKLPGTGLFLLAEFLVGKFAPGMTLFASHVFMLALELESLVLLVLVPERVFLPVTLHRVAGVALSVLELSLMNIVMAIIAIIRLDSLEFPRRRLLLRVELHEFDFFLLVALSALDLRVLALKLEPLVLLILVPERVFLPGILHRVAGVALSVLELSLMNVIMAIIAGIRLDSPEFPRSRLLLRVELHEFNFFLLVALSALDLRVLALKFEPLVLLILMPERVFLPGILHRVAGVALPVLELSLVNVVMAVPAGIRFDPFQFFHLTLNGFAERLNLHGFLLMAFLAGNVFMFSFQPEAAQLRVVMLKRLLLPPFCLVAFCAGLLFQLPFMNVSMAIIALSVIEWFKPKGFIGRFL